MTHQALKILRSAGNHPFLPGISRHRQPSPALAAHHHQAPRTWPSSAISCEVPPTQTKPILGDNHRIIERNKKSQAHGTAAQLASKQQAKMPPPRIGFQGLVSPTRLIRGALPAARTHYDGTNGEAACHTSTRGQGRAGHGQGRTGINDRQEKKGLSFPRVCHKEAPRRNGVRAGYPSFPPPLHALRYTFRSRAIPRPLPPSPPKRNLGEDITPPGWPGSSNHFCSRLSFPASVRSSSFSHPCWLARSARAV